ncbi:MAG: lipid-A-disaccharide synthase [Armatimonadota bacterium]
MHSIAISAGEASGDLYGAHLVTALRKILLEAYFWGVGGSRLREAGVDITLDTTDGGAIGIWASLKLMPELVHGYVHFRKMLLCRRPALFIPIDFGAFNLRLAQVAAKRNIQVVYFIPPSSWRKQPRNAKKLKAAGGKVITPFKWSAEHLRRKDIDARWVGHPLLDIAKPSADKAILIREFGLNDSYPIIGLLPGSRKHEIAEHLPAMISCAEKISRELGRTQFLVPIGIDNQQILAHVNAAINKISRNLDIKVIQHRTYDCMAVCDLLICKSGTTTLEAAIIGTPMIIVYRGTMIMRTEYKLRKHEIEGFIGLPNLIAGSEVCPEFLNEAVTGENIARAALDIISNESAKVQMREALASIREQLGQPGAIDRTAKTILEMSGLSQYT